MVLWKGGGDGGWVTPALQTLPATTRGLLEWGKGEIFHIGISSWTNVRRSKRVQRVLSIQGIEQSWGPFLFSLTPAKNPPLNPPLVLPLALPLVPFPYDASSTLWLGRVLFVNNYHQFLRCGADSVMAISQFDARRLRLGVVIFFPCISLFH